MSLVTDVLAMPPDESTPPAGTAQPPPVAFHYTQTDSFVTLLHQLGASLLVSTYQANKLLAVRASGQGLSTLVRTFERPMGLAVKDSRLALGTRKEVWFYPGCRTHEWRARVSADVLVYRPNGAPTRYDK